MSSPVRPAPMTALEGFKILSEEVLPKIIKRISALEQGSGSVDTDQITRQVIDRAMHEVRGAIDFQTTDLRVQLLEQYDDQAKRLDEVERFIAEMQEAKEAKKKRAPRKKKAEAQQEDSTADLIKQAEEVVAEPVVLEDATPAEEAPSDPDAVFKQIRAIAGVGLPIEDIAAKFGMTVEMVQEIVNG